MAPAHKPAARAGRRPAYRPEVGELLCPRAGSSCFDVLLHHLFALDPAVERPDEPSGLLQLVAVRFHLKPFDLEETAGYAKHHLLVAGNQGQFFSDSFPSGAFDHTWSAARKINNLRHAVLLFGATERKQILDKTDPLRASLTPKARSVDASRPS